MVTAPALIGRTEYLQQLSELARRAARGQRQVVFLAGPVGIGKTAITDAFAAVLNGFRQVHLAGMPGERLIGFAAVNRLLYALRGGRRGGGDEVPSDAPVMAAGGALLNAVDDLGGRPLLLVVDDAHQIDLVSLQALAFMLLRMPGDRLLAVVNTEHAYETRRDMGFVRDQPGITQLDVGGLTGEETRDFLTAMGVAPVSCSRLAAAQRWSAGNPLYLRALIRPAGLDRLPPENPAHEPIPPSLTQVVQEWVGTFPPGSIRVLEALAVLQAPAGLPVLRHMTDSTSLLEDIEPLIKEQVAAWTSAGAGDERIVLNHQGQQDALYAGIPRARRMRLHRAAAEVLEPPEHWRHQIASTEAYDGALARSLHAAAGTELDHGDPVRAAQYLLGISKVDPDAGARGAGLLQAVRLLGVSGHYQPALALAPRVQATEAGPGRAEALGLLELARGHDAGAAEHLLQAWRGYGDDDEQASRAAMELSAVQAALGLGRQAAHTAQFAVAHSADPAVIGQAQSVLTYTRALLAGPADALLYVSHLRENPADVPLCDLGCLALRGILRNMTGQLHAALSDLTVAFRRGCTDALVRRGGFSVIVHAAVCHIMLGGWAEARRLLSLGFDEAQTVGREADLVVLHSLSAMLAGFQGRWSTAQQDLDEARALVAASDFSGPHFHLTESEAALAFVRQDWRAVVESFTRALEDPSNRERAGIYRIWSLPLLGVAQARLGDTEAAEAAAAGLDDLAPYGALAAVCAAWVRGNAAAACHDSHAALRLLRDGLAISSYGGEPVLLRTMLRCDYGRYLIEDGQGGEAERQLTQAAEAFREMGADALEAPCIRLLERIDSAIPVSRAERFWDELTDRERDVAQLVGQGWTNKEIARELYVTMKTVEYHLRNIYVKGDAQNRRQVRDLVQMLKAAGY
ncbi:AAA family ATPase [Streptomyces sp. NPDC048409]|uniref:helix-turn-helix transcriptional regulator n=1 Tax=Streptomyces sp. NPDC048409 TaxID=3154723 RepID=UPI00342410CE